MLGNPCVASVSSLVIHARKLKLTIEALCYQIVSVSLQEMILQYAKAKWVVLQSFQYHNHMYGLETNRYAKHQTSSHGLMAQIQPCDLDDPDAPSKISLALGKDRVRPWTMMVWQITI